MGDKKGFLSFLKLDGIVDSLLRLVESKIELAKIEIKKDLSTFIAKALVLAILVALGFLFFLFLNLGLAFLISAWIDEPYSGFLIISGVYLIIFLLFLLVKDRLKIEEKIERKLNQTLGERD